MAEIIGNLWEYNLVRVVIVDVSDDYRLMQPPLPSECYPILADRYFPAYQVRCNIMEFPFVEGYLYDWHEAPGDEGGILTVGMVQAEVVTGTLASAGTE
ncbi:MAG: hypothetical protein MUC92_05465 [Fimbriimonadaceae bacterium]|jgi:hypothetical protein|nr:hypothetical protein [Fimbriimonadaceae bacterium]